VRGAEVERPSSNDDILRLVAQALEEYPASARLWNIRGDLIQLSEGSSYSLDDALTSYRHATELDPENPEGYESIGYFLDAIDGRIADAEPMFRKAIALGGRAPAWAGLARVLAELGRKDEALAILDPSSCTYANEPEIVNMREEIGMGMWDPAG
jgi:tetratricopeptide (TPR) repeat protein